MTTLNRKFYHRDTLRVARELLGKKLVRRINGLAHSGMIAETEASV
jgi:DNA-3-methyladenine glycosylase